MKWRKHARRISSTQSIFLRILLLSFFVNPFVYAVEPRYKLVPERGGWWSSTVPDTTSLGSVTGTDVKWSTGAVSINGVDYGWPAVGGTSGQQLTTNGSNVLSWAAAGGSSGNSFETIDVPAGTDPVADSSTDTLTITETSFLTLTGTASTDTIDITQVTTDLGTDGLIAANAVALGIDTTNAYVADLSATATETTVSGGGGETATVTIGIADNPDFDGDVTITNASPSLQLVTTTGDDYHWGVDASTSIMLLSNATSGAHLLENEAEDVLNLGSTLTPFIRLRTDGTGNEEIRLPSDSIGVEELDTADTPANAEVLAYQSSTGRMVWSPDAGASGGDSITVNSSAATDPDFLNGDVDWTLTGGNSITATVACTGCVDATDMAADSVGASEVIETESYTVADLTQSDASPSQTYTDTTASEDDFGLHIDGSQAFFQNVTDNVAAWSLNPDNSVSIGITSKTPAFFSVLTDGTGDGEVNLPSGSIGPSELLVTDGTQYNFSAINNSATTEGLLLPQGTDVSAGTGEGQIGWKTNSDLLHVGDGTTVRPQVPMSQRLSYWAHDEFLNASTESGEIGTLNWSATLTGTGTDVSTGSGDAGRLGVYSLGSGTTTTGAASINLSIGAVEVENGVTVEMATDIVTLANATDDYNLHFGLVDVDTCVSPVDVIAFFYDRDTSVNWICRTCSNSTCTDTVTGRAVGTGFTRYKMVVNSSTSVTFYINDVSVGVNTTNIPFGDTRETGPNVCILKEAGTTEVRVQVDYFTLYNALITTVR